MLIIKGVGYPVIVKCLLTMIMPKINYPAVSKKVIITTQVHPNASKFRLSLTSANKNISKSNVKVSANVIINILLSAISSLKSDYCPY